jgi:hypothetical protein
MSPELAKACAYALIPSLITMLLVQACGGSSDAVAQATAAGEPIEGAWSSTVTQRDCTTSAIASTFRSSQVFHRGGTFADTSSHAPSTRGAAFGTWTRSGDTYTTRFRFFRYNADGTLAGTSVSTMVATLSADGNAFSATRNTQVIDAAGNQVATVCTSDVATRG